MTTLYLVRKRDADHRPLLVHFQKTLDPDIVAKADVMDGGLDALVKIPGQSLIATISLDDPGQVVAVQEAFAAYGSDDFEINMEGPQLAAGEGAVGEAEALFELALPEGRLGDEMAANGSWLADLFLSGASGKDWPEKAYAGEDMKAYRHIVTKLGVEPHQDHGNTLEATDVLRLDRPHDVEQAAWGRVTEHLLAELKYFRYAREWYSDLGHIRQFVQDEVFVNAGFLRMVNDRYFKASDDMGVQLGMDLMMANTIKLITTVAPPDLKAGAAVVTAVMDSVWRVAKAMQPEVGKDISSTIADAEAALYRGYGETLSTIDTSYTLLVTDWGKLAEFGEGIQSRTLVWPTNATVFRVAASIAYQTEAFRNLLPASRWDTIVAEAEKGKPHQKAQWNPGPSGCHYHTHAEDQGKHGWWYYDFYVGRVEYTKGLMPVASGEDAPNELQLKLFGTDRSNLVDPQLGLSHGFYAVNPWKLKVRVLRP